MKLYKILELVNSLEKNSFLKIIDQIVNSNHKNSKQIDKILLDKSKDLKSVDSINVATIFSLIEDSFYEHVKNDFTNANSQLDILIDIITRDGNAIMKQDWFSRLYENEIKNLDKKINGFESSISSGNEIDESRMRDYKTFKACFHTAYFNDELNNQQPKISFDEQTILTTLANELDLSQEEIKLIKYSILPLKKHPIDELINELKSLGVIFYFRKTSTIYVADEIVKILRRLRGKELADKYFRRVLRCLKEPQINLVCKKHNIDRKLPIDAKINEIIHEGPLFSNVLSSEIFKDGTLVSEKKKFINELIDTKLKTSQSIKGSTVEEKIKNLITYFEELELDEKVTISFEGYDNLVRDLSDNLPNLNKQVKLEFQLQEENVLDSQYLLDYNIKPIDILDIISEQDLMKFCGIKEIKTKGDIVTNILAAYRDSANIYLENYVKISYRDMNALKTNGINFKEAEIGIKFEELTKLLFTKLGLDVDEQIRQKLNTNKDKIDLVINLGQNELILIECKTSKESGFNKFSSVSRQLKAYNSLAEKNGFKVVKSILVAPEFSDEFIKDCGLDYEINLSLLTASSLYNIQNTFKTSKLKTFPHNLLMKDVLIQEDRVIKAITK
jgi:hypothetical protein